MCVGTSSNKDNFFDIGLALRKTEGDKSFVYDVLWKNLKYRVFFL